MEREKSDQGRETAAVRALIDVSRAVARARSLSAALNGVAHEAAQLVGANAASVLLTRDGPEPYPLRVEGAWRLSSAYTAAIQNPIPDARETVGPAVSAIERGVQIEVRDTQSEPQYSPWRGMARREGYRALVSTPLQSTDGRVVGTLDVFRATPGSWSVAELGILSIMADHAAVAVRTAQLIDSQREQLRALRRLVRTLKEQSHEHANRLHTIHALLELDKLEAAKEFVIQLQDTRLREQQLIASRVEEPTLCALLTAQTAIAQQRGIQLRLTERSAVTALPARITEAEAVTVLGNLLDNAFDAVAEMAPRRRRVTVAFGESSQSQRWLIRDFGPGVPLELHEDIFRRGWSMKDGKRGLGLYLVADVVRRAGGRVGVRHHREGTTFAVVFPSKRRASGLRPRRQSRSAHTASSSSEWTDAPPAGIDGKQSADF